MRLTPTSLGGRLLFGAGVLIAATMPIASILIGFILHHFVVGQIDQRLDMQIAAVAAALYPNASGGLHLTTSLDGPPFDRLASGWYWQVSGDGVELRSRSLGDGSLDNPPKPQKPFNWRHMLSAVELSDAHGQALHVRTTLTTVAGKVIVVAASAPRSAIDGPMREALISLVGSLLILGIGLVLATFFQVRMGLRPLRRLKDTLVEIRAGTQHHVPPEQPGELQPLVAELNGLIDQNSEGLASARRHVSNLAHGLKTPLATLSIELQEAGRDPTGSMRALVDQIDIRIRHHLGRARASAARGATHPRTMLTQRITDIAEVMHRIHAERRLKFVSTVNAKLALACESQDLDEMLGNLLDNAFKWAVSTIQVSASTINRQVVIAIDDDGPGLTEELQLEALIPGRRLDETIPGHGFGLSITSELAELYGGGLGLARGSSGGLRATLTLPNAG